MLRGVWGALFARGKTVSVSLQDIAEPVKLYILGKGEDHFNQSPPRQDEPPIKRFDWNSDLTPAYVAEGWKEAAMWLQAAFSDESPKGDLYHSLYFALDRIARKLQTLDDGVRDVVLDQELLSLLKTAHVQFFEAASFFDTTAEMQARKESLIVQFRTGQLAQISAIPFRKFPGADHKVVARQLRAVGRKMGAFAETLDVPHASDAQISGKQAHHLRHES